MIGTDDFTIAGWVKRTKVDNTYNPYFFNLGSANSYIRMYYSDSGSDDQWTLTGQVSSGVSSGPDYISWPGSVTDSLDNWYHLTVTRTFQTNPDLVAIRTYINGLYANVDSGNGYGSPMGLTAENSVLILGALDSTSGQLSGMIDEVGIWKGALPPLAISQLYNSGQPTNLRNNIGDYLSAAQLLAYYRMEEGTGVSVTDHSDNSNTLYLSGGAGWSMDEAGITPTPTPTSSITPSITPSVYQSILYVLPTPAITPTISITPSITPSITITPSVTPSITITPSVTPSITVTPTATPSITVTPTITVTASVTPTPSPSIAAGYCVSNVNDADIDGTYTVDDSYPAYNGKPQYSDDNDSHYITWDDSMSGIWKLMSGPELGGTEEAYSTSADITGSWTGSNSSAPTVGLGACTATTTTTTTSTTTTTTTTYM
jgi:hypothetical protein